MPIDSLKPKVNRKAEGRNEKNIAAASGAAVSVARDQHLLQTSAQSLHRGKSRARAATPGLGWGPASVHQQELTATPEAAWVGPP